VFNPWLHRFALLTAAATLALIGVGGLVTSHGAGMAVPDWPNTYGYNLFFFPFSQWVGGIFYEHLHRLTASGVGLLTVILTLWLYGRQARPWMRWAGATLLFFGLLIIALVSARWQDGVVLGLAGAVMLEASFVWPRCGPSSKGLRWLGLAALVAVILQGVLGGLRVVLFKDQIGILHAALAQGFLVMVCAIAALTARRNAKSEVPSPTFEKRTSKNPGQPTVSISSTPDFGLRTSDFYLLLASTVLIFAQLLLGATMRHQHAGLAIPDFPLAYGHLWPASDPASVAHYNQQRIEITAANPITAFQIQLQMTHRVTAVIILGAVAWCAWRTRRWRGKDCNETQRRIGCYVRVWLGLILAQVFLGAATIWSNKAADIATAHVLVGALSLALGAIVSIMSFQEWKEFTRESYPPAGVRPSVPGSIGIRPAGAAGEP
jgi:heme a synthase